MSGARSRNEYNICGDVVYAQTNQGIQFKLSIEDIGLLDKYCFYASKRKLKNKTDYYIRTTENGKKKYLHRILMCPDKGFVVDHINGDSKDNRRINLRTVTHHENCLNRNTSFTSTGLLNVSKHTDGGYVGRFCFKGKTYNTSTYSNADEAKNEIDRIKTKIIKDNYEWT